jgi:hypothetical protein
MCRKMSEGAKMTFFRGGALRVMNFNQNLPIDVSISSIDRIQSLNIKNPS